jgi:hypothetical protein
MKRKYISYKNITFCCRDCGTKISTSCALKGQGRCRTCYLLLIKKPILFCIDCKKQLNNGANRCGTVRCLSCAAKERTKIPENNSNWKNGKSIIKYFCKDCNKEISYVTAIFGTYHCKPCSLLLQKGKNHPNYIDGDFLSPYPSEWTEKLRQKIRSRDGYKCQICNKTEKQEIKDTGKILGIHHIDYNKQNCKKSNLISLCVSCHIKTNYNRKKWIKFFN